MEPASPGDEGIAFVAYLPLAMPSKESGQGCAERTAEGGLALTRFRGMAFDQPCRVGAAFKSVKTLVGNWTESVILHGHDGRSEDTSPPLYSCGFECKCVVCREMSKLALDGLAVRRSRGRPPPAPPIESITWHISQKPKRPGGSVGMPSGRPQPGVIIKVNCFSFSTATLDHRW